MQRKLGLCSIFEDPPPCNSGIIGITITGWGGLHKVFCRLVKETASTFVVLSSTIPLSTPRVHVPNTVIGYLGFGY